MVAGAAPLTVYRAAGSVGGVRAIRKGHARLPFLLVPDAPSTGRTEGLEVVAWVDNVEDERRVMHEDAARRRASRRARRSCRSIAAPNGWSASASTCSASASRAIRTCAACCSATTG